MNHDRITRRNAAKRFFLASAVLAAPGWVLAGCKGELTCTDTKGLSAEDAKMRTTLAYVDKATDPNKPCTKCTLYKPAGEGQCGGCTVLKGPIHPNGSCNSFAPKT